MGPVLVRHYRTQTSKKSDRGGLTPNDIEYTTDLALRIWQLDTRETVKTATESFIVQFLAPFGYSRPSLEDYDEDSGDGKIHPILERAPPEHVDGIKEIFA